MKDLKGTGRTTRLIADAIKQAENGKAVYVIASSQQHARQLQILAGNKAESLGIKFEYPHALNFDWETMRVLGAHHNCLFMIDHSAIEKQFAPVLELLHKYDT